MYCPNCGNPLPDDAELCGNCGAPMKKKEETASNIPGPDLRKPESQPEAEQTSPGFDYNSTAPNYGPAGNHYDSYNNPPVDNKGEGLAIASLVLGCICLICWCVPFIGIPMAIIGLILGILGLNSVKRGLAIAGIILCSITLLLGLANAILGAVFFSGVYY